MVYVLAVIMFSVLLGSLYFIRQKRVVYLKEKQIYSEKNNRRIFQYEVFNNVPQSIIFKNQMNCERVVDVSDTCSWQDVSIHFVSAGGTHVFRYDTILIKDVRSIKVTKINKKIKLRYPCSEDIVPERVSQFLQENDLSIDAGSWGVVLIRNQGAFEAEALNDVITRFYSIVQDR